MTPEPLVAGAEPLVGGQDGEAPEAESWSFLSIFMQKSGQNLRI